MNLLRNQRHCKSVGNLVVFSNVTDNYVNETLSLTLIKAIHLRFLTF
jgi:hypothetical protein